MKNDFEDRLIRVAKSGSDYDREAYLFIYEALDYTLRKVDEKRHVSGRELLNGVRSLAIEKFGPLAKSVFNSWGVYRTDDFGEIVFNLVKNDMLSKTEEDTKDDFADVFDFDETFGNVKIKSDIVKRKP